MRRLFSGITALLLLSLLLGSAGAQAFPISLNFGTALPVPIGQTNTVTVTVKDVTNNTVQLTFLGLRFEWSPSNSFFIGQNSEKGAVLAPGQDITYSILVVVPGNVTPGTHRLSAYVTYRILTAKNATAVQAGWWVADLQFAQTQQQQTSSSQAPPPLSTNLETMGMIVVVVAIGLFLERRRIMRLVKKKPKEAAAGPAQPEPEKPAATEEEEDL